MEKKKVKVSRWNYIFKLDGQDYVYNTFSCGFAEINRESINMLEKISESKAGYLLTEEEYLITEDLRKGFMIIPYETAEIKLLSYLSKKRRFNDSSKIISLTLVPTLDCNFRCIYCFQEHEKVKIEGLYMSKEIQSSICEYIEFRAKRDAKRINICWYGGEPLLAIQIIASLSKRITRIASKYNIPYDSSIVTNGYLLDDRCATILEKNRIWDFQITIDGPENIHNKRRPLLNGEPTYTTIVDNISRILKQKNPPSITLRVNVDSTNDVYIDDLIHDLDRHGLMGQIGVYLAPVTSTTKSCGEISNIIFSSKEMIEKDIAFVNKIIDKNMVVSMHYPRVSVAQCMAVCPESNLIGPDGTIWPCWDVVGRKEESIGNIITGIDNTENFFKWCLWEPFDDEECLSCKVLPICMGGCPARRVPLNQEYFTAVFDKKCSRWRWGMEEYLKLIVKVYNKTKNVVNAK